MGNNSKEVKLDDRYNFTRAIRGKKSTLFINATLPEQYLERDQTCRSLLLYLSNIRVEIKLVDNSLRKLFSYDEVHQWISKSS
jgi:hypothetical protein